MSDLDALQQRLHHQFADQALLKRAVTHRSFSADHNERLEFLGDSVLNLAISSLLFKRMRDLPEGELSRVRALLVRQESLHTIATRLQLSQCLRLGDGETKSGGKQRPSILADVLEAVIGAVYLDAGYLVAEALVQRLFEGVELSSRLQAAAKDAKTVLQEWMQGQYKARPQYQVLQVTGAAHKQQFHVECVSAELRLRAQGVGVSRRAAEQAAAAALLQQIQARKKS